MFIFGLDVSYKVIDKGLIEAVGPTGIQNVFVYLSKQASRLQSGQVYNYALAIIIFVTILTI